jgi:hypothetical protein
MRTSTKRNRGNYKLNIDFIGLILITTLFTACGSQKSDLTPSKNLKQPIPPVADISYESYMKYGELKTIANGWEISIDTTDPVETRALVNGWTAEVKHK